MSTATFSLSARGRPPISILEGLGSFRYRRTRPVRKRIPVPPVGPIPLPREAPGMYGLGQAEAGLADQLERYYQDLRATCVERAGHDFCNNVLPQSMYNAMGRARQGLPWWGWLVVGILAGRILRI